MENRNETVLKWAQTALLAALCFVTFTFLQIKIPMPGGDATSLHIGNAFCVLAALLLGGGYGGLAGAVGMTIADILDPVYIVSAPKTFVLKLCIGLITGLVAHKIAKNRTEHRSEIYLQMERDRLHLRAWLYVIFDPLVGYFYKQIVLGQPQEMASVLAKWSTMTTFVNAVVSVILVAVIYNVLRPALAKAGLLVQTE